VSRHQEQVAFLFLRVVNVMGLVIFCRIYVSQPADSEDRDDEV
jgi:hypothetical protein